MPSAGQSFAHFRILSKLGEGGMGEVFLAEDQKLHRKVAIKTLSSAFLDSKDRLERFQREARTAAQINNAHVMSIYDISSAHDEATSRDVNFIVMEYVEGKSLSQYLKDAAPDFADIVRVGEKIAIGLAAAHKLNIVHRDIKPDNIIVDGQGNPSILDFGLAKPLDPVEFSGSGDQTNSVSQNLTQVGKIMGTVSYMSPEQVQGQPVDTRSDIFSFGILLYRMVTGELPFAGPTQVSTMAKILESTPEPLRVKDESIPSELERIISKCLKKDSEDRYQDTRDLVVDLRNLRKLYDSGSSESISILADRSVKKSGKIGANLSWKAILLTVLLAPMAVGAIALIVLAITGELGSDSAGVPDRLAPPDAPDWSQRRTNGLAILGFDNKTSDESYDWLQTGLPEILLTDLATHSVSLISRQRVIDYFPVDERKSFTHGEAMNAAAQLGATNVLSGSFYKLGNKLRIDARVEKVGSGDIVWSDRVVGEDPFALVDSLTAKIAKALDISPEMAGENAGVTTFTSSSPEAYKLYLEGMELFTTGFLDKAIESFNKALMVDSTFALPYMRIGMANVFEGRQQIGAGFFRKALQYNDKLPIKERTLLDAYADLWLNNKFDDAAIKMKAAVANYPDDKEIRTIHGLLISVFERDTVRAFAQIDTALMIDPSFPLALELYGVVCENHQNIPKAIEYCERLREYYPQSPSAYESLPRLYRKIGRLDDAIAVAEDFLAAFPDRDDPYFDLTGLSIRKREFARARGYMERLAARNSDDPFIMRRYYNNLASLANWEGKFQTSMDYRFKALEKAFLTNDSNLISNSYDLIATYYRRYNILDSLLYYAERQNETARSFNRISWPISLAIVDPANDSIARPMLIETLSDLKARLPSDLWPLFDNLKMMYDGLIKRDTAMMIAAIRGMNQQSNDPSGGNARELGYYLINYGEYQEGIKTLEPLLSGAKQITNGFGYPKILYFVGKAYEALGDKDAAVKHYREMLSYWAEPEIELDEIVDARKRLADLTS